MPHPPVQSLRTVRDLASGLAGEARRLRGQVLDELRGEAGGGTLGSLLASFQEGLAPGLEPEGFADLCAQTVTYGLLAARLADPARPALADFAAHLRTCPLLKALVEAFREPAAVAALLDGADLEAVLRDFRMRHPGEDPVLHLYEPFLAAYDRDLKMRRGVFYTPRAVVASLVRDVHERLRTVFGLEDGLADTTTWGELRERFPGLGPAWPGDGPFVRILDPATGTGAFLVEVIDAVHRTLQARWEARGLTDGQRAEAWNAYVPAHLLPRLHAFEVMPAPFAIAHMQVGLKLARTGYRFGVEARAGIHLASALEAGEAERRARFTVVLGNPPFSNFGLLNRNAFIQGLLEDYKRGLCEKKLNLDDDYIKFLRLGQHLIETAGAGVLAFITASSYLEGAGHRRMRQALAGAFPDIRITDLHGNIRRRDACPGGGRDENVFDIMQGVAIGVMVRGPEPAEASVTYRGLWGSRQDKLAQLAAGTGEARRFVPRGEARLFVPRDEGFAREYEAFASLKELFGEVGQGLEPGRSVALASTRAGVEEVVADLAALSAEAFANRYGVPAESATWGVERARRDLARGGEFLRIGVRPFDAGWTWYSGRSGGFHHRPRTASTRNLLLEGNVAIVAKRQSKEGSFSSAWAVDGPISQGFFSIDPLGRESLFPLFRADVDGAAPNLLTRGWAPGAGPRAVFACVYALLHSPAYRSRYRDFLRADFPRVPRTADTALFQALAGLGERLLGLHLAADPAPGADYHGPPGPEVEKVAWAGGAIWLDRARSRGFTGVEEAVWNFQAGGYRLCEKWLKDRKGRALTDGELVRYRGMVGVLRETLGVMDAIDAAIGARGGWPGAFEGGDPFDGRCAAIRSGRGVDPQAGI